jgi:predicted nucleotidyltransferase
MPNLEIEELKKQFVEELNPLRIYLFGSYADDTYTDESDLDFYIMISDGKTDIVSETTKAYKAVRKVKTHPIDIIVGTKSRFESRKNIPSVENEVYRKGILLYDTGD